MHRNNLYFLTEGMRAGDLADLVMPLVSIDEFESKVDDHAVVIGFYVSDKDAADDLNRFIQRSPVDLLDTDVSPAPDQNGFYMVFVELLNNENTASVISEIVEEISPLCSLDHWEMQVRGEEGVAPFHTDVIVRRLRANLSYDNAQTAKLKGAPGMKESISRSLAQSDSLDVIILEKDGAAKISIRSPQEHVTARVKVVSESREELDQAIAHYAVDFGSDARMAALRSARVLGVNWDVVALSGGAQAWLSQERGMIVDVLPS